MSTLSPSKESHLSHGAGARSLQQPSAKKQGGARGPKPRPPKPPKR